MKKLIFVCLLLVWCSVSEAYDRQGGGPGFECSVPFSSQDEKTVFHINFIQTSRVHEGHTLDEVQVWPLVRDLVMTGIDYPYYWESLVTEGRQLTSPFTGTRAAIPSLGRESKVALRLRQVPLFGWFGKYHYDGTTYYLLCEEKNYISFDYIMDRHR